MQAVAIVEECRREDGWTSQSRVAWVILNVWCVRDRANNGRTGP